MTAWSSSTDGLGVYWVARKCRCCTDCPAWIVDEKPLVLDLIDCGGIAARPADISGDATLASPVATRFYKIAGPRPPPPECPT